MADGSTNISWELVYKLSCSWVDVLDPTASVYQSLCKSQEKCNGDPGND
jgi:hypothetical protein